MLSTVAYRTVQRKTETGMSTIISLLNSMEAGQCGVEVKHVTIITTKKRSQHSNWATDWTRWGLNLDRVKRFFSFPKLHTGSTAHPATHSMATGITSLGKSRRGVKSIFHFNLASRLRMCSLLRLHAVDTDNFTFFFIVINRSAYQIIIKQDKHCTYNVILWHFRVTIVGVEKVTMHSVCVLLSYMSLWTISQYERFTTMILWQIYAADIHKTLALNVQCPMLQWH